MVCDLNWLLFRNKPRDLRNQRRDRGVCVAFLKFSSDIKKITENNRGTQIQKLCFVHLNRHFFLICSH